MSAAERQKRYKERLTLVSVASPSVTPSVTQASPPVTLPSPAPVTFDIDAHRALIETLYLEGLIKTMARRRLLDALEA